MPDRPYTVLSCAMSIDGYLDSAGDERLILSNEADLDRVDQERAGCDAILVGATTVRKDDPRLLVRCPERRLERVARGLKPSPLKVTVTCRADLDPTGRFFTTGEAEKLVYSPSAYAGEARFRLGTVATVVDGGARVSMRGLSEDLHERGVRRLMVEGGGTIHTQFLAEDVADELQLVVAPFFVGDSAARRFVDDGPFPARPGSPARLADVRRIGEVVLMRYQLSERFAPPRNRLRDDEREREPGRSAGA